VIVRVWRAWDDFFFTPTSALTLGVFRGFFGLVVFVSTFGIYPYRNIFYGENGIVSPDVMEKTYAGRNMILGFHFVPPTDPELGFFFLGLLLCAALLSLGLFTRLASLGVFLGVLSLHNRNGYNINAGDLLMRINALVLVFADSGAAFSLDRWIRIKRGQERRDEIPRRSAWPVRLLQLQLTYLYFCTAYLKIAGESWRDGTALYYALGYLELRRFALTPFFYYLWQIKLATWGVIVAEFSMGSLVWVRRLRYPVLIAAFFLHLGINLSMQFPIFQYMMMINLILFVYPEDLDRLMKKVRAGPKSFRSGPAAQERMASSN
jgi:hypothetical protein